MAGPLDLYKFVQQQGQVGREAGTKSRLGQLYSQAIQSPQQDRTSILSQISQTGGADAAVGAQQSLSKMDDAKRQRLGEFAAVFDQLPDEQKAMAYPQFARQAQEVLGLPVPDQWDPEFAPRIRGIAQALRGGASTTAEAQNFANMTQGFTPEQVREARMIQAGLKPRAGLPSVFDTGAGVFGIDRGNYQATPINVGGQPQQQAPTRFMGADGMQVSIDPSLPPEVQASIRQNEAGYASLPDGGAAQIGPQEPTGQQLRSTPEPSAQPDTFVTLSQDEIAAEGLPAGTVAQRNLKTGKVDIVSSPKASADAKPMPVSALRLVRDSREKMSIAQGNIDSLTKIRDQVSGSDIDLGPVANRVNQARNFAGMSSPESRNFGLMMSSLEKLRNDSLRLNNGVQTEGDAQRAWNELMANLNDDKVVAQQLDRIIEINQRAVRLHQENMDDVTSNYGPGRQASPEQSGDVESLLEMYR